MKLRPSLDSLSQAEMRLHRARVRLMQAQEAKARASVEFMEAQREIKALQPMQPQPLLQSQPTHKSFMLIIDDVEQGGTPWS